MNQVANDEMSEGEEIDQASLTISTVRTARL